MMIKKGPHGRSLLNNRVGVILDGKNLRLDPPRLKGKTASSDVSDESLDVDPQSGSS